MENKEEIMDELNNTVDWVYWKSLSSLTIREATCLLAGVEPYEWDVDSKNEHPLLCKFHRMISRALLDQELSQCNIYGADFNNEPRIKPADLSLWLSEKKKLFSSNQNGSNIKDEVYKQITQS